MVAGYGAIACAMPYLALKIVWLGGGTLGGIGVLASGPVAPHQPTGVVLHGRARGLALVPGAPYGETADAGRAGSNRAFQESSARDHQCSRSAMKRMSAS